jgi:hypothetical protein
MNLVNKIENNPNIIRLEIDGKVFINVPEYFGLLISFKEFPQKKL